MSDWWRYENLERRAPYDWSPGARGVRAWDQADFHIDLGCGRVPKGRLGIDLRPSPDATDLAIDLNTLYESPWHSSYGPKQTEIIDRTVKHFGEYRRALGDLPEPEIFDGRLPFPGESIKSIISHHALEHIGDGFERLMEECYRVLEFGGVMRVIVPLFPSYSAVAEYDHKRYFMEGTLGGFCQEPTCSYTDGFSERYNSCCFRIVDEWMSRPTPPEKQWTREDSREIRTTLWKPEAGTPMEARPNPEAYR